MAHQVDEAYCRMAGEGVRNVCGADLVAPGRSVTGHAFREEKYPVRPEESPVKLRSASEDSVEAERITRTLPSSLEQGIVAYCGSHPVTEAVLFETALVFEEQEFTYRELDGMSNSLAYFLRGKGIKPNDVVPIIAKTSWHVVVAMLGILKAGGAYMPVDPNFPEDRSR